MSLSRPYIGGQAVLEGVMMRSPASVSVVCRRKSGELVVREQPMPPSEGRGFRRWPLVRGVATLVESLRLGSRALRWSAELYEADHAEQEEGPAVQPTDQPANASSTVTKAPTIASKVSQALLGLSQLGTTMALTIVSVVHAQLEVDLPETPEAEAAKTKTEMTSPATVQRERETWRTSSSATPAPAPSETPPGEETKGGGFAAWLPMAFALLLFVALPQAAADGISVLLKRYVSLEVAVNSPLYQVFTGCSKLLIVVGYLLAIRRIPDVRRVFQYHGAEHKTISTYEAGEELLVATARAKTTMHPRCGTTFLVMVAIVSIAMFTALGSFLPTLPGSRWAQSVGFFLMKLPFLPVIAAITFEIQRVFARHCTVGPLRALLAPGFLVQRITTAEPDDDQLEVALAALRATLWREESLGAPVRDDRTFPDYQALQADPGYGGL